MRLPLLLLLPGIAGASLALAAPESPPAGNAAEWPGAQWSAARPEEVGLDPAGLVKARDYALTADGSGLVVRHGRLALAWGDPAQRYDLKSSTKSFGSLALGLAIGDGKVRLDDPAMQHHPEFGVPPPENAGTGWLPKITLRHLATHTAGFDKPGGYAPLRFAPEERWSYSDAGPNWLAECVTVAYGRDLNAVMFERVFTPLGITPDELTWRKNAYRPALIGEIPRREFGAGIHASVNAMARVGLLCLRGGRWKDRQLLPRDYVERVGRPEPRLAGLAVNRPEDYGDASSHYGLLWWNNGDGKIAGVPRDAYWSWGLYDSLIVVIPSLDLVVARAGPAQSWKRSGGDHYDVLKPFLQPIAGAVRDAGK
jgi:CubicO group peptidase (beta-lactamase class C family)